MQQRIGILGGTFNPIHYGHLAASEEVRERLKLDKVLFVPSFLPPHKRKEEIPSASQRLEMVRLAVADNDHFEISEIEISRGGKSYTVDTIAGLRASDPGTEFFFITGVDSFLEIETWKDWQHLLSLCAFVVLSRPGYHFSDLLKIGFIKSARKKLLSLDRGAIQHAKIRADRFTLYLEFISHYDISSTMIRKRLRRGGSVKYLLPDPVENYIIKNKIYG